LFTLSLLTGRGFYTSASSKPSGLLRVNHAMLSLAVRPGDSVIDATCGNGYDSLYLARLVLPEGKLWCIDKQESAIAATRGRLEEEFGAVAVERCVRFVQGCHSKLPAAIELPPASVAAVVYNLGYLPGGPDKSVTTQVDSTLQSLRLATGSGMVRPDGLVTVVAYRHSPQEEEQVRALFSQLPLSLWDVSSHCGLQGNGTSTGPILYSARRRV